LEGHNGSVIGLFSHPVDHSLLLSISEDQSVRLWHLPSTSCISIWNFDQPFHLVCFVFSWYYYFFFFFFFFFGFVLIFRLGIY
jgi:WD40 repeat protein